MRIGILQADEVRPEFQDRFGDYPDMFQNLLRAAAVSENLEFTIYRVYQNRFPQSLDECDAYLITGSRDSVYDEADWIGTLGRFVRQLHKARKKLVGICFGHQLVAHYLGGKTRAAAQGWAVGVQKASVIETMPWMEPALGEFSLISSHQDQVISLPDSARIIAGSEFCPVGGFVVGDHILTLQGHPEFNKEYSRTLIEMRRQVLGEGCYEKGCLSLASETQEALIARWILNFLEIH